MRSILVDAGPLIALFNSDDAHHTAMKDLLRDAAGRLITTWPVVTEASHQAGGVAVRSPRLQAGGGRTPTVSVLHQQRSRYCNI